MTVPGSLTPGWDINADGGVDVLDLVVVGSQFGSTGQGLAGDVNRDGRVDVSDLVLIGLHFGESIVVAAPPLVGVPRLSVQLAQSLNNRESIGQAIQALDAVPNPSREVIIVRHSLWVWLAQSAANVKETKLLSNYPNPFNLATWIPYQLADDTNVTLRIYDLQGRLVRELSLGYHLPGVYQGRERAAYWDGCNNIGERVASGTYLCQMQAGEYVGTRSMTIVK